MFFGNAHLCTISFYMQIIWLGLIFKIQTLDHLFRPLADLWVLFWVHLRVPKWPQNERKDSIKTCFLVVSDSFS
jgi:hypothetical protein